MSDFTSGRYEDALSKFKEIIKTEKNEAVMRRIADCYYFLGEKGDKRHVLMRRPFTGLLKVTAA
jgi:hypothetical protein